MEFLQMAGSLGSAVFGGTMTKGQKLGLLATTVSSVAVPMIVNAMVPHEQVDVPPSEQECIDEVTRTPEFQRQHGRGAPNAISKKDVRELYRAICEKFHDIEAIHDQLHPYARRAHIALLRCMVMARIDGATFGGLVENICIAFIACDNVLRTRSPHSLVWLGDAKANVRLHSDILRSSLRAAGVVPLHDAKHRDLFHNPEEKVFGIKSLTVNAREPSRFPTSNLKLSSQCGLESLSSADLWVSEAVKAVAGAITDVEGAAMRPH
jgi:hypothetical protein